MFISLTNINLDIARTVSQITKDYTPIPHK